MAGNINVYTPIQATKSGKYFNHIIFRRRLPTLEGKKHLSVHFFLVFSIFRRKKMGSNPSEMDIKVVNPAPTQKTLISKKDQTGFPYEEIKKIAPKKNKIHKIKYIKMMNKLMFTCVYLLHDLNSVLGAKPGFFLVRSTFLPARASLWPKRSGTTM